MRAAARFQRPWRERLRIAGDGSWWIELQGRVLRRLRLRRRASEQTLHEAAEPAGLSIALRVRGRPIDHDQERQTYAGHPTS